MTEQRGLFGEPMKSYRTGAMSDGERREKKRARERARQAKDPEKYCAQQCARDHARRAKDPEKHRIRNRASQRKSRNKLLAMLGEQCACCGISFPDFLQFDHVNGDGAEHRRQYWEKRGEGNKSLPLHELLRVIETGEREIQLLCGSCNFAKGTARFCPCGERAVNAPLPVLLRGTHRHHRQYGEGKQ